MRDVDCRIFICIQVFLPIIPTILLLFQYNFSKRLSGVDPKLKDPSYQPWAAKARDAPKKMASGRVAASNEGASFNHRPVPYSTAEPRGNGRGYFQPVRGRGGPRGRGQQSGGGGNYSGAYGYDRGNRNQYNRSYANVTQYNRGRAGYASGNSNDMHRLAKLESIVSQHSGHLKTLDHRMDTVEQDIKANDLRFWNVMDCATMVPVDILGTIMVDCMSIDEDDVALILQNARNCFRAGANCLVLSCGSKTEFDTIWRAKKNLGQENPFGTKPISVSRNFSQKQSVFAYKRYEVVKQLREAGKEVKTAGIDKISVNDGPFRHFSQFGI